MTFENVASLIIFAVIPNAVRDIDLDSNPEEIIHAQ